MRIKENTMALIVLPSTNKLTQETGKWDNVPIFPVFLFDASPKQRWKKMAAAAAPRVQIFHSCAIFISPPRFIKGFWPFMCNFGNSC